MCWFSITKCYLKGKQNYWTKIMQVTCEQVLQNVFRKNYHYSFLNHVARNGDTAMLAQEHTFTLFFNQFGLK